MYLVPHALRCSCTLICCLSLLWHGVALAAPKEGHDTVLLSDATWCLTSADAYLHLGQCAGELRPVCPLGSAPLGPWLGQQHRITPQQLVTELRTTTRHGEWSVFFFGSGDLSADAILWCGVHGNALSQTEVRWVDTPGAGYLEMSWPDPVLTLCGDSPPGFDRVAFDPHSGRFNRTVAPTSSSPAPTALVAEPWLPSPRYGATAQPRTLAHSAAARSAGQGLGDNTWRSPFTSQGPEHSLVILRAPPGLSLDAFAWLQAESPALPPDAQIHLYAGEQHFVIPWDDDPKPTWHRVALPEALPCIKVAFPVAARVEDIAGLSSIDAHQDLHALVEAALALDPDGEHFTAFAQALANHTDQSQAILSAAIENTSDPQRLDRAVALTRKMSPAHRAKAAFHASLRLPPDHTLIDAWLPLLTHHQPATAHLLRRRLESLDLDSDAYLHNALALLSASPDEGVLALLRALDRRVAQHLPIEAIVDALGSAADKAEQSIWRHVMADGLRDDTRLALLQILLRHTLSLDEVARLSWQEKSAQLLPLLAAERLAHRILAARLIGLLTPEGAEPALLARLDVAEVDIEIATLLTGLAALPSSTLPLFLPYLTNTWPTVRIATAQLLARPPFIDAPECRAALRQFLAEEQWPEALVAAFDGLVHAQDPAVAAFGEHYLARPETHLDLRHAAAKSIAIWEQAPTWANLLQWAAPAHSPRRLRAILLDAAVHHPTMDLAAIRAWLPAGLLAKDDKEADFAGQTLRALVALGAAESGIQAQALAQLYDGVAEDSPARLSLIEAMASYEDPELRRRLQQAMGSDNAVIAETARRSLAILDGQPYGDINAWP